MVDSDKSEEHEMCSHIRFARACVADVTISAEPVGVGAVCQPWILAGERSGLLMHMTRRDIPLRDSRLLRCVGAFRPEFLGTFRRNHRKVVVSGVAGPSCVSIQDADELWQVQRNYFARSPGSEENRGRRSCGSSPEILEGQDQLAAATRVFVDRAEHDAV
jgi:hypothetical protein